MGLSSRFYVVLAVSVWTLSCVGLASAEAPNQEASTAWLNSSTTDPTITISSLDPHLAVPDTIRLYFARVSGGTGRRFTVSNDGDLPVTLSATPMTCGDFRLDGPREPEELLPGESREYFAWFYPQTYHDQTCGFSIAEGLGEFGVSAKWSGGTYQVSPRVYSFGMVSTGQMETLFIWLGNYSGEPLHLEPILTGDTDVFEYTGQAAVTVADGDYVAVLPVQFHPGIAGAFSATLELGGALGSVSFSGSSAEVLYAIHNEPSVVEIMESVPGQSSTATVTVTNTGALPVTLEPYSIDPFLRDIWPTYYQLAPGESHDVTFTYEPSEYGRHEFKVVLVPSQGFTIRGVVWPQFDFGPDENRIGLFFDTYTKLTDLTITPEPQTVFAHLVILNPSDPSGVAGWECRVKATEGTALAGYEILGDNINASYPPDFTVGVATPLPSAPQVILATFEFVVWDMSQEQYGLELVPTMTPSIPGLMSWVPGVNVENLTPLLPVDGDSTVARIYLGTPVALALPTPMAESDGEAVVLTWQNTAGPNEGYHVWRRVGDSPARRLTSTLFTSGSLQMTYRDTAPGRVAGEATAYSYRLVSGGIEVGTSPEVVLDGPVLPRATRLLANVPNPFNPQTEIRFEIDRRSQTKVAVYDVAGRRVRTLVNDILGPGTHAPVWDGRDDSGRSLSSGAYYIRLETETKIDHRKVMLLK